MEKVIFSTQLSSATYVSCNVKGNYRRIGPIRHTFFQAKLGGASYMRLDLKLFFSTKIFQFFFHSEVQPKLSFHI